MKMHVYTFNSDGDKLSMVNFESMANTSKGIVRAALKVLKKSGKLSHDVDCLLIGHKGLYGTIWLDAANKQEKIARWSGIQSYWHVVDF